MRARRWPFRMPDARRARRSPRLLPFVRSSSRHVSRRRKVIRQTDLAVEDPMAVFAFVFESLPERVKVYPTENYYYFSFFQGGVKYAGNISIEPNDNGGQTVHFTYFEDASEWHEDVDIKH